MKAEAIYERIEVRVDIGCWEWVGQLAPNGYGKISARVNGRPKDFRAHRVVYEMKRGPIPAGLDIDHLCRNRRCVNPLHLEPVTRGENVRRSPIAPTAINARKTHCIHGHEFTPDNIVRCRNGRRCKRCGREWQRRQWERVTRSQRDKLNAQHRRQYAARMREAEEQK